METQKFDVIIVGAGPAGCAAAHMLSGNGLRIALLDKDIFPRDKICGDAFGADVTKQFHILGKELTDKLEQFTNKVPSNGVSFFTPDNKLMDIEFTVPNNKFGGGFISRRLDFDNFFFSETIKLPDVEIFQDHQVLSVVTAHDKILLNTAASTFEAKIALGADGAHSILNKRLTKNKVEKKHYCGGVRQYYSNVHGFHAANHIELHFYKEILPGYLWVFPLPGNKANVGLGMLSSEISKKKINLKIQLEEIITKHPNLKDRFKDAVPLETIQGYGLPLGSKKRSISGIRFLLLGDAAGLIDPFTGEGIANAIRSGRIAASHVLKGIERNSFDADFNCQYDKEIYHKMWNEFRIGHSMQKLFRHPSVINFVVKKANNNKSVQMLLSSMLNNLDMKKELVKPSFYFRLFFT
ncbi:MAG: geranylgeranyl reductase family protein [Bacteroidota bacterium]|nr:geranylgeranyl reductase family protein [Bacteroidota bacterium]